MENKNTNRDRCDHKWTVMREASFNKKEGGKMDPAVFQCKKENCNLILTASEALQLSAYKKQTTATRILVITTIIAFLALIISVTSLLVK